MKQNYKMDFTTNTLTITKDFEKKAMNVNSVEYQTLKQLKADFPSLRIVRKASPKRKSSLARPTYDKMVKFLSCQANSAILLKAFAEVREYSKAQENPYQFVREWFFANFPNYQSLPKFDEAGNLIAPTASAENRRIIPMEEPKEVA